MIRAVPPPRPQGANRPSPREITLALLHQPYFKAKSETNTSYLLTALGQLVCEWRGVGWATGRGAHCSRRARARRRLTRTPAGLPALLAAHDITRGDSAPTSNGGRAPIPVPPGDPFFSVFENYAVQPGASRRALPFTRSNYTRCARRRGVLPRLQCWRQPVLAPSLFPC